MISFCPKCQIDNEPWHVLTTEDGMTASCEKHGFMTVNDLMNVKAELDVLGKNLHYLTIVPFQNNEDRSVDVA